LTQASPDELWTRYLNWCSAQVARRFLELTPEQTWELADRAQASPVEEQPPGEGGATHPHLIRLVTLQLFSEMGLPSYSEWLDRCRIDPSAYEEETTSLGESPAPSAES